MNDSSRSEHPSLPPSIVEQIDQVCDRFEIAAQAGSTPKIEDYLGNTPEPQRSVLFRQLLLLELDYLQRDDTAVQAIPADYLARFPEYADLIDAVCAAGHDTGALPETAGTNSVPQSQSHRRIRYFGDYELLEEIAHGGMGVVYKARQVSLNRVVAVKMILSGQLATDEDVKRFHAEAEAAANLDHPNIVPIYEVGDHEGQHYFSMAYVEGRSLADAVRETPLPSKVAAEYVKMVAGAIDYAHSLGVIHRDLKPSNVLIDQHSQPRVTDFGLAKRVGSDSDLTATGQILGTPGYMPPEQALSDQSQVGPKSDIYSLGAILYCLITGRPPFAADSAAATLIQVIEEEAVPPRRLNPSIDRDLETIALKCLEKSPGRRYDTCGELSAELGRYLEGRPIRARPISRPAKAWRWCLRNPVVAGLCAALVLLLITAPVVTSALAISERAARERERQAQERIAEEQRANDRKRAESLVQAVLAAPAEALPYVVQSLEPLRGYAVPMLQERARDESLEVPLRMHAFCALAEFGQVEYEFLIGSIGDAQSDECANIASALRHAPRSALESLRQQVNTAEEHEDLRLKARLAIVSLHLGGPSAAQDMCQLRPDPIQRTVLIDTFPAWHPDLLELVEVVKRAEARDDAAFRSGICLGIGGIPADEVSIADKQAWQPLLSDWYQNAPDTGTHSAAGWALRQWQAKLPDLPPNRVPGAERDWYVNRLGMTMLRIPAGSFKRFYISRFGSRNSYMGQKYSKGSNQKVTLTRSFFICDREVSVGVFQQFADDSECPDEEKPTGWPGIDRDLCPTQSHPIQDVTWEETVLFCNWLSRKEGLPPCYERTGEKMRVGGRNGDEIDVWRVDATANGYRLPTEAEWEYACRAGTVTDYVCGDDESFLSRYAVYFGSQPEPCGNKICNGWGLFDTHGNVSEYCYDWANATYSAAKHVTDPAGPTRGRVGDCRVWRGGWFVQKAAFCSSVHRNWNFATNRTQKTGFRPVRTCP